MKPKFIQICCNAGNTGEHPWGLFALDEEGGVWTYEFNSKTAQMNWKQLELERLLKQESEFGKGLAYCLGLFLCHSERDYHKRVDESSYRPESWFNASSDHLYELQIPDALPDALKLRLADLQDKCLSWGHGFQKDGRAKATAEDMEWAIDEAKSLLHLIDEHFGIATVEASWK